MIAIVVVRNIFGRKIAQEDVRKSVVVFMLSAGMCLFSILFLTATEDHSLISIIKHEDDHRFSHILLGDFPTKNIDVIFIFQE
jgi:hypothetical protein